VDFKAGRMTVRSPKTEHHDGKASRVVPIFPELRSYLEAAKAVAVKGAEYVVTLLGVVRCRGCDRASNLGTEMARIIKRAGLTPWPKLMHNLRATRQTELAATFPEHVVCEWIGNSQKVAREHYLRVTEADYQKAANLIETDRLIETGSAEGEPSGEPSCARSGSRKGNPSHTAANRLLLDCVEKALRNDGPEKFAATIGKAVKEYLVPRVGLEPTTY
jgi:hypothetical protein